MKLYEMFDQDDEVFKFEWQHHSKWSQSIGCSGNIAEHYWNTFPRIGKANSWNVYHSL